MAVQRHNNFYQTRYISHCCTQWAMYAGFLLGIKMIYLAWFVCIFISVGVPVCINSGYDIKGGTFVVWLVTAGYIFYYYFGM